MKAFSQTTNYKGSPTLPKLNPISPVDRDVGGDDMRVSSPQIKQEPSHDGAHVDSYHSMSEALQTVSFHLVINLNLQHLS